MVDKISGATFLNTNYYLNIEGTAAAFTELGITPSANVGDRKDVFAGAGNGFILEIDASNNVSGRKTQRQTGLATQVTAKTKAVLTLLQTYLWKGKNIHKKVSVSFPHNCPVIFQTKVLTDYISTKDKLKKFKGYYTWKRSPGGRFALVDVPAGIITNMITEMQAAKQDIRDRAEGTTTRTEVEPV